jgi:PAS domain-containing protein
MNEVPADQSQPASGGEQGPGRDLSPTDARPIEMILVRQLAGYLALAVVLVDPAWNVVYYNEPAERIIGRRFDEAGPIPWTAWSHAFEFTDMEGRPLPIEESPLLVPLRSRQMKHLEFRLRGLDGGTRHLGGVGIPLVGNAGRFLGVVGVFQELDP